DGGGRQLGLRVEDAAVDLERPGRDREHPGELAPAQDADDHRVSLRATPRTCGRTTQSGGTGGTGVFGSSATIVKPAARIAPATSRFGWQPAAIRRQSGVTTSWPSTPSRLAERTCS